MNVHICAVFVLLFVCACSVVHHIGLPQTIVTGNHYSTVNLHDACRWCTVVCNNINGCTVRVCAHSTLACIVFCCIPIVRLCVPHIVCTQLSFVVPACLLCFPSHAHHPSIICVPQHSRYLCFACLHPCLYDDAKFPTFFPETFSSYVHHQVLW